MKICPGPLEDFKVTPARNLLVLNTTKAAMDAAPQVNKGEFTPSGQFDRQKVDVSRATDRTVAPILGE